MLSAEENCANPIEPPNELEVNHAFTRKMNHLLCVMKVLQKFKTIKAKKQLAALEEQGIKTGQSSTNHSSEDISAEEARADEVKADLAKSEVIEALLAQRRRVLSEDDENGKGHARDVSEHEPLFLGIGTGARDDFAMDEATPNIVADSPTAVDFNIYDKAYTDAVEERLKANPGSRPILYLTRFVKEKDQLKNLRDLLDEPPSVFPGATKLASLVAKVVVDDSPGTL